MKDPSNADIIAQPILGQPLLKRMASPLVLGFAAYRVWLFLVSYSTALFLNAQNPLIALNSTFITLLVAEIALLALASLAREKFKTRIHASKSLGLFVPIVMVGGTLCYVVAGYGPVDEKIVVFVGSVLNGLGAGFALLVWGEAYCAKQTHSVAMGSISAYIISSIVVVVLLFCPSVVIVASALALPFLCAGAAFMCKPHAEPSSLPRPRLARPSSLLVKIGITAGVFGLSSGIVGQTTSKQIILDAGGLDILELPLAALMAAIIVLVIFKTTKSITFDGLYRTGLVLVIMSVLMPPLFGSDNTVASFVATMGKSVIELMIWILVCAFVHRYRLESLGAIGISQGLDLVGLLIGAVSTMYFLPSGTYAYSIYGIVVIVAIIIAYTTMFSERDIDKLTELDDGTVTPEQRIDIIGRAYRLSPREMEIFHEMAAGYSNARICEDLVISKGTLNTHLYKIYGKLGVHSRQDVTTLIAETDLDALSRGDDATDATKRSEASTRG